MNGRRLVASGCYSRLAGVGARRCSGLPVGALVAVLRFRWFLQGL